MNVAPTGQTCVQGESAQWLHILGTKKYFSPSSAATGNPSLPPSGEMTSGWSYSRRDVIALYPGAEEAVRHIVLRLAGPTQLPQPMHLGMSINMPHQCSVIL